MAQSLRGQGVRLQQFGNFDRFILLQNFISSNLNLNLNYIDESHV